MPQGFCNIIVCWGVIGWWHVYYFFQSTELYWIFHSCLCILTIFMVTLIGPQNICSSWSIFLKFQHNGPRLAVNKGWEWFGCLGIRFYTLINFMCGKRWVIPSEITIVFLSTWRVTHIIMNKWSNSDEIFLSIEITYMIITLF